MLGIYLEQLHTKFQVNISIGFEDMAISVFWLFVGGIWSLLHQILSVCPLNRIIIPYKFHNNLMICSWDILGTDTHTHRQTLSLRIIMRATIMISFIFVTFRSRSSQEHFSVTLVMFALYFDSSLFVMSPTRTASSAYLLLKLCSSWPRWSFV